MKKTIFLATVIAAFSITTTYAQDNPPAEKKAATEGRRGGDRMGRMYQDLNLSQDQKDKIKALNEDQRSQFDAIKNDASLNDDQKKEKMGELRKARKEKMGAILTDDQKAKLEAKMKERAEKRRGDKQQ